MISIEELVEGKVLIPLGYNCSEHAQPAYGCTLCYDKGHYRDGDGACIAFIKSTGVDSVMGHFDHTHGLGEFELVVLMAAEKA